MSAESRRFPYRGPTATIAIVGGGASGALTAIQLLRKATFPLKIVIIEPRANLGGGIAYSTEISAHLLNVPAGQMSAFADEPDHFLRWLGKNSTQNYGPHSFASRSLYGDYLADTLYDYEGKASRLASIDHYRTRATRVEKIDGSVRVTLRNDIAIIADRVVLALGHHSHANRLAEHDVPSVSAWSDSALADLDMAAPVLLVGTGLTAVDVALELDVRGHRGPIYAVSRHGKWPHVNGARGALKEINAAQLEGTNNVRNLLRSVRTLAGQGYELRSIIDCLRHNSPAIWTSWSPDQRRRFVRHLRPYWEIHRHQMPLEVAAKIDEMRWNGRLTLHTGRIKDTLPNSDGSLDVSIALRGGRDEQRLKVSRIIDCTGPETDYRRWSDPLVDELLRDGLARVDLLALGLLTDDFGALIEESGFASPVLHTLGPARRATMWESTAIREIRVQAASLARHLLDDLRPKTNSHKRHGVATLVEKREVSRANA